MLLLSPHLVCTIELASTLEKSPFGAVAVLWRGGARCRPTSPYCWPETPFSVERIMTCRS